jgi:hypothetical protein
LNDLTYYNGGTCSWFLAGIKPNGEAEATFYATIQDMKEHLLSTLEWTIEDLQHKGDKNYTKHFKDGVS